jgi:hypothetical protein
MRTTVTLDPDVEALVKQLMQERGISFKEAVNQAIRAGLGRRTRRRFRQRTFAMGFRPDIPYEKSLRLAGELEDQEILRKLSVGK